MYCGWMGDELDKMRENWFIEESVCPWGATVELVKKKMGPSDSALIIGG